MPHSTLARIKILEYPLSNGQMIVRISKHNGKLNSDHKVEFERDFYGCIFVRIIKIAPFMTAENVDQYLPGSLVVIQEDAGELLPRISELEGRQYRLISENDVIVYSRPVSD